jgi:GntR family transcriptional regulator/MocR family aminotransferase
MSSATGADFLQLDPAAAPARGMTDWLADAIRAAILDGRLQAGALLPATRVLADDLGISRGVTVEAYQRLADEGLVSGRPGAGTRVLGCSGRRSGPVRSRAAGPPDRSQEAERAGPRERPAPPGQQQPVRPGRRERPDAGGMAAQREGLDPALLPERWRARAELDLSPGLPDLSGFPRAAWLRAERAVLEQASTADLGYGDPRGCGHLRAELTGWLARTRGLRTEPDDIIIVTGVAQALALLAQRLAAHEPADRATGHGPADRATGHGPADRATGYGPVRRAVTEVGVEDPGSRGSRDELAYWGLRPVPVPVDEHGLQVDALVRTGVRAVSLTPAHQFPTGVVLAPQRRRELLDWAAATDALIIEDDYDAEYRYDRAPVPALQASAPGHVAYAGSTSKTLAPGMRLGWLIPPPRLHAELVEAKRASDLGSPALPQLVLAQLIASGELEQHIRTVRKRQRSRRDALLGALAEQLPQACVQGIAAGLHLLITFPELAGRIEDTELAERILRAGVLVHPLSWHRQRPGVPGIILGYAVHTPDQLRAAVRRIALVTQQASPAG